MSKGCKSTCPNCAEYRQALARVLHCLQAEYKVKDGALRGRIFYNEYETLEEYIESKLGEEHG